MLAKSEFLEVLTSKVLIDSNISHDEFVLENSVLKEFYDVKEEIKNLMTIKKVKQYIKWCYRIVWSVEKYRK